MATGHAATTLRILTLRGQPAGRGVRLEIAIATHPARHDLGASSLALLASAWRRRAWPGAWPSMPAPPCPTARLCRAGPRPRRAGRPVVARVDHRALAARDPRRAGRSAALALVPRVVPAQLRRARGMAYAVPVARLGRPSPGRGRLFGLAGASWRDEQPRRVPRPSPCSPAHWPRGLLLAGQWAGRAADVVLAVELASGLALLPPLGAGRRWCSRSRSSRRRARFAGSRRRARHAAPGRLGRSLAFLRAARLALRSRSSRAR